MFPLRLTEESTGKKEHAKCKWFNNNNTRQIIFDNRIDMVDDVVDDVGG